MLHPLALVSPQAAEGQQRELLEFGPDFNCSDIRMTLEHIRLLLSTQSQTVPAKE